MSVDDKGWRLIAAKLLSASSQGKGNDLMNRMYSMDFWSKMCSEREGKQKPETSEETGGETQRIVIIREIVKLRCRYCGGLYDEAKDRCPYCGGIR